jgi:hypothetical protein
MEFPLEGAKRTRAVLIVSLVTAAFVSFQAARIWLADHRVQSGKVDLMQRGAALEPGNAEAWDRLGRMRQWDILNADPVRAVADFEKAVKDDPFSAHYWMDLAAAYEDIGDIPKARSAFERARAVYPSSAEVAWFYGNFLLRQEDDEGYAQVQRAVRADPGLLAMAISRTWRSSHDVQLLLDRVLPPDTDAYFQALDFLAENQQTDAGLVVWQRLLALGKPITLSRSFPFLDELIHEERAADTQRVWLEALAAAGMPHDPPADQSLVWNGDFSKDFTNGGLDWRWEIPPGVGVDFDSGAPGKSGRSLRLDFTGGMNVDLTEPHQFVPVEPSHTYRFHAYLRTQSLTTESGVRMSIQEPFHRSPEMLSENLTGTHPWTSVDADVTTGPDTHFLRIRLRRVPSRLFDNKLSGAAWLADVTLTPVAAQPGQLSR